MQWMTEQRGGRARVIGSLHGLRTNGTAGGSAGSVAEEGRQAGYSPTLMASGLVGRFPREGGERHAVVQHEMA